MTHEPLTKHEPLSYREKLLILACLTGFFGDLLLQILNKTTNQFRIKKSLGNYFNQHGSLESLCIATGMLALFYIVYLYILKLPVKWYYIAICAIILDLIFRLANLFPSLKDYYSNLGYFWSAVWAVIPMLIPLGLEYLLS